MIIQTNTLKIRSFSLDDVYGYYEMVHNDHDIAKYVPYAYVNDIREARENVQSYHEGDCVNDFYLVVEQKGVMVGAIIAVRTQGKTLDTSVVVASNCRGQGIMKEALTTFVNWLRTNTKYEALTMVVMFDNKASNRLAQKCGATFIKATLEGNLYKLNI